MISSTDFPVISDGNFGVEVATTVEVEVVPLLEATVKGDDV